MAGKMLPSYQIATSTFSLVPGNWDPRDKKQRSSMLPTCGSSRCQGVRCHRCFSLDTTDPKTVGVYVGTWRSLGPPEWHGLGIYFCLGPVASTLDLLYCQSDVLPPPQDGTEEVGSYRLPVLGTWVSGDCKGSVATLPRYSHLRRQGLGRYFCFSFVRVPSTWVPKPVTMGSLEP